MHDIALKLSLIAVLGIFAQWLAWRMRLPAIVLLLVAGFLIGPATGYLNPAEDLGEIYRPLVSLAVAIILFEGGLTLNFAQIRETSLALRRIIVISGPVVWLLTAVAAHYVGGLSWPSALVLGAILVVTGPTVIMPLLRNAQLQSRPASLLRWEAIVNDPIGALAAVMAFEVYLVLHGTHDVQNLTLHAIAALIFAVVGGYGAAKALVWAFTRGHVAEYLKAPVMLALVLIAYATTNLLLEEAGLLTVTVMGIVLANSRIASLAEMRRFKETITVLLVSGLFILLTAALDSSALASLDAGLLLFALLVIFVIRPIAIFTATAGTNLSLNEKLLIAWIAPRGIVAVAVSGLFAGALANNGVADGERIVAFTFAIVVLTIILHGFSLSPLAGWLNLRSTKTPGLLIVGGTTFTTALAKKLHELEIPVLIADNNWNHLREARLASIPVYFGEILSEDAHHHLELASFATILTATDSDSYNTLVCSDFGPELGRNQVFQLAQTQGQSERRSVNFTLGGRPVCEPTQTYYDLRRKVFEGWGFQATRLSNEFPYEAFLESRHEGTVVLMAVKPSKMFRFLADKSTSMPQPGETIISFSPNTDPASKTEPSQANNGSD